MKFTVYIVGDKIEKFYLEAIKEYGKRLNRYCQIQLKHHKTETSLLKEISNKSYCILISTKGHSVSSEELASKIQDLAISGTSNVSIVINSENIRSNESLTLSTMEMDVGLKATIIFEQIYRAYRIVNNHPYHK